MWYKENKKNKQQCPRTLYGCSISMNHLVRSWHGRSSQHMKFTTVRSTASAGLGQAVDTENTMLPPSGHYDLKATQPLNILKSRKHTSYVIKV